MNPAYAWIWYKNARGMDRAPFEDNTSSLQKLKQQKFSTPEALESVFDTKEVLAEPHWPKESTKYRHRRPRGSVLICSEDFKIEEIGKVGKQKAPVKKNSRLRKRRKHREKVQIAGHLKNHDFHHIPNVPGRESFASFLPVSPPVPSLVAVPDQISPFLSESCYATPCTEDMENMVTYSMASDLQIGFNKFPETDFFATLESPVIIGSSNLSFPTASSIPRPDSEKLVISPKSEGSLGNEEFQEDFDFKSLFTEIDIFSFTK